MATRSEPTSGTTNEDIFAGVETARDGRRVECDVVEPGVELLMSRSRGHPTTSLVSEKKIRVREASH